MKCHFRFYFEPYSEVTKIITQRLSLSISLKNNFLQVNEIARSNWEKYVADEYEEPLQGHLLMYPIDISQNGTVSNSMI